MALVVADNSGAIVVSQRRRRRRRERVLSIFGANFTRFGMATQELFRPPKISAPLAKPRTILDTIFLPFSAHLSRRMSPIISVPRARIYNLLADERVSYI